MGKNNDVLIVSISLMSEVEHLMILLGAIYIFFFCKLAVFLFLVHFNIQLFGNFLVDF